MRILIVLVLFSRLCFAQVYISNSDSGFQIKTLGNADGVAIGIRKDANLSPVFLEWGADCSAPSNDYVCYLNSSDDKVPFIVDSASTSFTIEHTTGTGYGTGYVTGENISFSLHSYANTITRNYRIEFPSLISPLAFSVDSPNCTAQWVARRGIEQGQVLSLLMGERWKSCNIKFDGLSLNNDLVGKIGIGSVRWRYDPEIYNVLSSGLWNVTAPYSDSFSLIQYNGQIESRSIIISSVVLNTNIDILGYLDFSLVGKTDVDLTLDPNKDAVHRLWYDLQTNGDKASISLLCDQPQNSKCTISNGNALLEFSTEILFSRSGSKGSRLEPLLPFFLDHSNGLLINKKVEGSFLLKFNRLDIQKVASDANKVFSGELIFSVDVEF
ncbi:hypothetical protein QF117_11360 [Vibrio sp. YMD68]|uniref:hypothetical protein n=1 Tax=Vibrio sp. YMD68 TaxID=3042300 RepID=UPI00249A1D99|nr:hypothetical protein [Vibrio sp. YMD68]WGW01378.1 hypothetical protein QF117_11360 [Vibrio sp. YMD68]